MEESHVSKTGPAEPGAMIDPTTLKNHALSDICPELRAGNIRRGEGDTLQELSHRIGISRPSGLNRMAGEPILRL